MSLNNFKSNSILTKDVFEPMGLGMELRSRRKNYPNVVRVASIYTQSNSITTTERSIGMPPGSADNFYQFLDTPSQIKLSSTSANDTSAGTGARTILITGLYKDSNNEWYDCSETMTLNGQTGVLSTRTDWWRINKMYLLTAGSSKKNEGALYLSKPASTLTAGVPNATNTLAATLTGFSNSTMGIYSVGSNRRFD